MTAIRDLLSDLDEFQETVEGFAVSLQLDLSELILRHLAERGWTQSRLAKAVGVKPPYITRLIHSDENCGIYTIAKVFHTLGVKPKLIAQEKEVRLTAFENPQCVVDAGLHHFQPHNVSANLKAG